MPVSLPLNAADVSKIQISAKPIFLNAQTHSSVPWQAIAGIWYRESFSISPPKTPGGPFQFDPVPSSDSLAALLKRFTDLDAATIAATVIKGVNDFEAGALFCACWLRHNCDPVITVDASDATIKDAIYGYNGRAYGSADLSPYVMNGFDNSHLNMVLKGSIPDGHGHRIEINTVDHRPGAFTVYTQLKQERI